MYKYFFKLGHQPKLSIAEIEAMFEIHDIEVEFLMVDKNFFAKTSKEIDCTLFNKELGGTVYIAKKIKDSLNHVNEITEYLNTTVEGKIAFSIHGKKNREALQIKKKLKELGRSVRYIEHKNSATIVYNSLYKNGADITIIDSELYATQSVQELNQYAERDFDKPGSDSKSGMLPPKLARMMINIGRGHISQKSIDYSTLLDPFCGSGAVLLEGLSLGFRNVLGSDNSQKAVDDTTKNVEWYKEKIHSTATSNVQLLDAQKMYDAYEKGSVALIVSEPYMGKPLRGNESIFYIEKQAKELEELYTNAINEMVDLLHDDGAIVFLVPTFHHKDGDVVPQLRGVDERLIDVYEGDHLFYHREGQHLTRVLHIFKKN